MTAVELSRLFAASRFNESLSVMIRFGRDLYLYRVSFRPKKQKHLAGEKHARRFILAAWQREEKRAMDSAIKLTR